MRLACSRTIPITSLLIFGMGLTIGCGGQNPTTQTTKPIESNIELSQVTYAGFDAVVKEQKGKVVVIDVWFMG